MTVTEALWDNVNKLQEHAGVTDGEMSDICRTTRKQYRTRRTVGRCLSFHNVCHLADAFNFSLTKLAKNDIDAGTAAKFYRGETNAIPSKYLIGAASRTRSIHNFLKYVRQNYGDHAEENTLRYLQCTKESFKDGDKKVSIAMVQDILKHLELSNENNFFKIGLQTAKTVSDTPVGKLLHSYRDSKDMYQGILLDHYGTFETNNIYTIKHSDSRQTVIHSNLNPEICEALKVDSFGDKAMDDYRAGVIASLNYFQTGHYAKIKQTKFHYTGDNCSEFTLLH